MTLDERLIDVTDEVIDVTDEVIDVTGEVIVVDDESEVAVRNERRVGECMPAIPAHPQGR